mgnify:CR=1 FL=1
MPAGLVAVSRVLRALGHREIRLKLHPGYGRAYYQAVSDQFGLGLEIVEAGLVPDHLAWADLVVGPVESGAMVEAWAIGRPYLPLIPRPHAIDLGVLGPLPVLHDAEDLRRMLVERPPLDRAAIVEHFCAGGLEPGRASTRFWERVA